MVPPSFFANPNPAVSLIADSDPAYQNCGVTFKLCNNMQ